MKARSTVVLASTIGVLATGAVGAAAFAATPAVPGSDGYIRICVEANDIGHYNDLRFLVNGKTTCGRGEKLIFWNQKGPVGAKGATGAIGAAGAKGDKGDQGDKGDKGDKGDPGTPGSPGSPGAPGTPGAPAVLGLEQQSATISVADGAFGAAVARCSAGKIATGGGVELFSHEDVFLYHSMPEGNPATGWSARIYNDSGANRSVRAYVICVNA